MLPTVKYSTKKHYKYMLRVHLYPAFGDVQLRLITRDAVQRFLSEKLQSGLARKTVKHLRTVFGTVVGAAETEELIPSNQSARGVSLGGVQSKRRRSSVRRRLGSCWTSFPSPRLLWLD